MKKALQKDKKKLIYRAIIVVQLFLLIGVCTYAWFESNFDPIIYSNPLKITSSDGLFIQLTDDTTAPEINSKEIVRDFTSQFGVAQVSSTTGANFFKKKGSTPATTEYLVAEKNSDYIELSFMLSGETEVYGTATKSPDRYIYIKSFEINKLDSSGNVIADSAYSVDALRTCLKFQREIRTDEYETHEYLMTRDKTVSGIRQLNRFDEFKNDELVSYSTSLIKQKVNDSVDPFEGYEIYNAIVSKGVEAAERYGTQKVNYASQYIYNESSSDFTSLECIPNGYGTKVTIDIWLEGADPRCDLGITGTKLDYKIVFGSYYYMVDFDTGSGDPMKPLIFNSLDQKTGAIPNPTNYTGTFVGWYDKATNTPWNSTTVIDKNYTLKAVYA